MGSQLTIAELLGEIRKGELILPEFQRGFVWNREKVRDYLRSLYLGYPTGSFLIWRTPLPGVVRGGEAAGDGSPIQLILDGQQRLTSAYTIINGEPPPFYEGETLFFNIHFNVETEEFRYYNKTAMQGQAEWVPVTEFLKLGLGGYLKKDGPLDAGTREFLFEYHDRLNQLDNIKQYTYYLETLGEREMDEVVRIFNLVNKQGTPLAKADLALSYICANWPGARATMQKLQDELRRSAYDFDLSFLVRAAAAIATGSGRLEPVYDVDFTRVRRAWDQLQRALPYLVNVLRTEGYMPSSGHVTSINALIVPAVYLARKGGRFESEEEKSRFLHWTYSAILWGRYSGPTETRLTQDIQALDALHPTQTLLEHILADRGRLRVEARDLIGASTRTGWMTIAYCAAQARGARDWVSGVRVRGELVGDGTAIEYHHIFPSSVLYRTSQYDSKSRADVQKVNELANIAFLTSTSNKALSNRIPEDYFLEVETRYPGALSEQFVPANQELWRLDRFEDFVESRRQEIASAINIFMDSLLEDDHPVADTIEDYVRAGESETVEFKSTLRWNREAHRATPEITHAIVKTIAAFMNTKGGTLVVGVADDGSAVGIEIDYPTLGPRHQDRDGWEQALAVALSKALGESVASLVECSFAEYGGTTVAIVRADEWVKPVFVSSGDATEFYVRIQNTSRRLDPKETLEYIAARFPGAK